MKKVYNAPEVEITQFNNQDTILLTSNATVNENSTLGLYTLTGVASTGKWNS